MNSLRFVGRQRLLGDDRLRRVVDDADLREALGRIVFQVRIKRRRRRLRAHVADRDGVAVRRAPARRGSCRGCRRRRRCSRRRRSCRACAPMCSPTRRATTSVGPPAANGTMTVIGLVGYCCASAGALNVASAASPPAARKRMHRIVLSFDDRRADHGR